MPGPPRRPIELTVDLTIFGDAPDVIETRVPRSVYGSLRVGDIVTVVDDSAEPQRYQVSDLTNGGRDVRLRARGDADTPWPQGTANVAGT